MDAESGEPGGPSTSEVEELLDAARLGAIGADARGADVDDVSQIASEKLTTKWNEPHVRAARNRGAKAWRGYVAVTARNSYRDLLRTRRRSNRREERYARRVEGDALVDRPGVERPQAHTPSDIDHFLSRLLVVDTIEEHLDGLQREVALLFFVEGRSNREISEILGIAVRTARDNRRKALARLRAALDPEPPHTTSS